MKIIFYISLFCIFYTYLGFPLLISFLQIFKKNKIKKAEITPFISIVISAFNEEKNIAAKLNEVLTLNYPKDKMEVLVISDASTDKTDEIVSGFMKKGVRLHRMDKQSGKIAAYKQIFPFLKGEIIIFSDATSILSLNSVKNLVANFNDETVGCAGGLLMYVNPKQANVGKGERKYWSYEKRILECESNLCSLLSVSGTFYAVRRELFPLDMKLDLADDLMVPFNVVKKGKKAVLENQAVCKDFTTLSIDEEMNKRIRITIQNIRGLIDQIDILNPLRYGLYSILVISHKLLRILIPIFLIILFISSLFLSIHSGIFRLVLIGQILFYLSAITGHKINQKVKFSLGNILFYFCLSNLAILKGIFRFLRGEKVVTWQTVRA